MHKNIHHPAPKPTQSGFTLIELSLVILIVGVLLVPLLQLYHNYATQKLLEKTNENILEVQSLINGFSPNRYPCPADPLLSPADALYGVEQCAVTGGITSTAGARTAAKKVLIGAVPIKTLKATSTSFVPDNISLDAFGNKLLYAVTTDLTTGATYSFDGGQIAAINEFLYNTAGINGDAHYAIISHGFDGNGAFSDSGAAITGCIIGVGARKEDENCNGDSTFMASLGAYEGSGVNPDYYDDYSYFGLKYNSSLWSPVVVGSPNIFNTNSGNVGIKTTTPTEKLDVNGNLIANNRVKVTQICDYTGAKCFDVDKISGTGMSCSAGQVMVGITNGTADCVTPTFAPVADVDCGAIGKWVTGIKTDGSVICTP